MPPMNREEKVTLAIFLLTVMLWIISPVLEKLIGIPIPISMPVLLTSCLFFIPGLSTIPWKKVEEEIEYHFKILKDDELG